MPISRIKFHLLASAALCLPVLAQAQDAVVLLDEVILQSGGLSPIAEAGFGRAYTVLEAETLEARGLRTVQDALRSYDITPIAWSKREEFRERLAA